LALNDAFDQTIATDALRRRLREIDMTQAAALDAGLLTPDEGKALDAQKKAAARVIAVDDFAPDALAAVYPGARPPARSDPSGSADA
jgi:acyl-CoA dehydrogenase